MAAVAIFAIAIHGGNIRAGKMKPPSDVSCEPSQGSDERYRDVRDFESVFGT
jgi:hypothetical protein